MSVLEDVRLTAGAFAGVATSGAMPGWRTYVATVEASGARERAVVTDVHALRRVLGGRSITPRTTNARAIAALVSFADDHRAALPGEMFPAEASIAFIDALALYRGDPVGPADQLALALDLVDDAWAAILVCHLATRQLARARDTRALGPRAPTDIADRCAIGAAIAAFPPELARGGDPLGDTYHYWANVAAGALASSRGAGAAFAIERLFRAGPALMSLIREGVFGSYLFYGNHARIDALGLEHGLALCTAYALGRAPRTGLSLAAI